MQFLDNIPCKLYLNQIYYSFTGISQIDLKQKLEHHQIYCIPAKVEVVSITTNYSDITKFSIQTSDDPIGISSSPIGSLKSCLSQDSVSPFPEIHTVFKLIFNFEMEIHASRLLKQILGSFKDLLFALETIIPDKVLETNRDRFS